MNHLSKKDIIKTAAKWLIIFGLIMTVFCAYQYRLGSMYTSRMISFIGSLEHPDDVKTAIFSTYQNDTYQKGLQLMKDAGYEDTGISYLYHTITSYGRTGYVMLTAALCIVGMICDLHMIRKNAMRCETLAEQARQEERDRLQEEKEYLVREQKKMGIYMENIAHQIKTPAAGMMLNMEYLLDTETDEQKGKRLEQCISQLERMSDMTASLLRLAQIDSGKIWMKKRKESLYVLLEESAEALRDLMEEKHIELQTECLADCILSCDAFWMREAFKNLLKNAVEHTPAGGKIRMCLSCVEEQYDIRIYNSGAVITDEQREAIFDRFYQTNPDKKDSFGIGLHLSREIFRMHQGTVRVLESDEKGTTFQILLPVFVAKEYLE